MEQQKANTIDEYIALFSPDLQELLQLMRHTIISAVPNLKEIISYGMPAFKQNKILVYFAANKNHIGFYPTAIGIETFKDELNDYKWSKGAIQFPLNKPLPIDLITKITKFKAEMDLPKKKNN